MKEEEIRVDDAISRQAVINAIANTCFWLSADNWEELTKCIDSLSSVTPQPKMGRWIDNHNNTISCDRCHTWFNKDDRYGYMHYCPNCGAKMESNKNTGE